MFGRPLGFYFFDLPFYSMLLNFLAVVAFCGGARVLSGGARLADAARFSGIRAGPGDRPARFAAAGAAGNRAAEALGALFLVALAAEFWLGRYDLLLTDHGNLMVGLDYMQQNIGLPLQTLKAAAALLAAVLVLAGRRKLALACAPCWCSTCGSAAGEQPVREAQ